ncbi:tRNA(adenine(34)) deaminase, chloroplastic-like [Ananas comosus]|uniref:tRNA(adenine(34)) deaminase n=1 Tax=Ananas comosus TaxID=4615 RepID=A0A6P5EXA7_ANACO|nr:tRNA(adenine(34)) deaminase, chloroplastic-like [Ananas comosus]
MYSGYATTALLARANSSFHYSDRPPSSSVAINPSLLLLNAYLLHRHSAFLYWSRSRTFLPARAASAAERRRCCCCCCAGAGAAPGFAEAAIGFLAWERSDLRPGTSREESRRGERRDRACSACGSERSRRRGGGERRRRLVERQVRELWRYDDDDDDDDDNEWEEREKMARKDKGSNSRVYGNRKREDYDYDEHDDDTACREAFRRTSDAHRGGRERVDERTARYQRRSEESEEEERDLRTGSRKFTRTFDRHDDDDDRRRRAGASSTKVSKKDLIRHAEERDHYDSEEEEQHLRRRELKERTRNSNSDRRVVGRSERRIEDSKDEERDEELCYEARSRSKASARTINVREDDTRSSSSSLRKMVAAKKVSKQDSQLVTRTDSKENYYQNNNRKIVEDDSRIIGSSHNRFDSRKTDYSVGIASSSKQNTKYDLQIVGQNESKRSSEKIMDISEVKNHNIQNQQHREDNSTQLMRNDRTQIDQQVSGRTELDVTASSQNRHTQSNIDNKRVREDNFPSIRNSEQQIRHSRSQIDQQVIDRTDLSTSNVTNRRSEIDQKLTGYTESSKSSENLVDISEDRSSDDRREDRRDASSSTHNLVEVSRDKRTDINQRIVHNTELDVQNITQVNVTNIASSSSQSIEENRRDNREHTTFVVNLVGGSNSGTRSDDEIHRQSLEVSTSNIERLDNEMIENRRLERQHSFRVDSGQNTVLSNYSRSDIERRENRELIREVEEERSRIQEESQQQTSQMVISGSLESATRLQDSSASYVGEFVDKLSQEMSNSDKRDNSLKISSEIEAETVRGRTSQGTVVDTTAKHKDGKHTEVVLTTSTQTGESSSAQKTHKSLWAFVADIIRLGWIHQGESHNPNKKSGKKSLSHNSTSTEAWFSGQEHETDETQKKGKISSPKEQPLLIERPFDTPMITSETGTSASTSVDLARKSRERTEVNEEGRRSTPSVITVDQPLNVIDDTASASIIEITDSGNAQVPVIEEPPEILQIGGKEGELRRRKLQRNKQVLKETFDDWEEALASSIRITDSGNTRAPIIDEPHEFVQSEGRDGELEQRKLQRNNQVVKETFDEWEEAFKRDSEQRKLDEFFMREALVEAQRAADIWEVPVGAVLVQNGEIIARGCNLVEELRDSTAHAEMICIREASNVLRSWRLAGTTLYITLEPCPMCAGAILQARIDTVVWGAPNKLLGADGSWVRLFPGNDESNSLNPSDKPIGPVHPFHPNITIRRGVLAPECAEAMQQFFHLRRKKRNKKAEPPPPPPPPPPSCLPMPAHPLKFFTKMPGMFSMFFCV